MARYGILVIELVLAHPGVLRIYMHCSFTEHLKQSIKINVMENKTNQNRVSDQATVVFNRLTA